MKGHRVLRTLLGFAIFVLVLLMIGVALYDVSRHFPLESLILAVILAVCGLGVILYIGELVLICWAVDFLSEIGMPKIDARPIPLEYERVGEIIVVTLRYNIVTLPQCVSVQKQLQDLIDEECCDFVLDFFSAGKISRSFRGVMVNTLKAARRKAAKLGKPSQPVALRRGAIFKVFADRQQAVEAMCRHGGHGWVVLCSLPVGIRAVAGLT